MEQNTTHDLGFFCSVERKIGGPVFCEIERPRLVLPSKVKVESTVHRYILEIGKYLRKRGTVNLRIVQREMHTISS